MDTKSILAPFIILSLSLIIGTIVYSITNGWDFSLSYYFAASVLLGDMYLVPTERSSVSQVFTLVYFLWGTTLLAGAIAWFANIAVTSSLRSAAEERKRLISRYLGEIESETIRFAKKKYLAFYSIIGWLIVGILYGIFYERWAWSRAIFFALAAISTAGSSPPVCEGKDGVDCTLGTARSLFLGTYIVIGVPIFTFMMGQITEILVDRAVKANERKLLMQPLSEEDFAFAYNLQKGRIGYYQQIDGLLDSECAERKESVKLDFGDFIVLELLRLEKIAKADLEYIKSLFDSLDSDGDGVIIHRQQQQAQDTAPMLPIITTTAAANCRDSYSPVLPIQTGTQRSQFNLSVREKSEEVRSRKSSMASNSPFEEKELDDKPNEGASEGYNRLIIPHMRRLSISAPSVTDDLIGKFQLSRHPSVNDMNNNNSDAAPSISNFNKYPILSRLFRSMSTDDNLKSAALSDGEIESLLPPATATGSASSAADCRIEI